MALISCPECGRTVSDQAATCPNCGISIKQRTASRIPQKHKVFIFSISGVIILGIIGIIIGIGIYNKNKNERIAYEAYIRRENERESTQQKTKTEYYSLFPDVPTVNNIKNGLEDYSTTQAGTVRYSVGVVSKSDLDEYRDYIAQNGFIATETKDNSADITSIFSGQYYFNFESRASGTKYYACLVDMRDGKGYQLEIGEGTLS